MAAVLPASRHIQLGELRADLGQHVDLATEQEIEQVFRDCDRGAIPQLGLAMALMRLSMTALISCQSLFRRRRPYHAGSHDPRRVCAAQCDSTAGVIYRFLATRMTGVSEQAWPMVRDQGGETSIS